MAAIVKAFFRATLRTTSGKNKCTGARHGYYRCLKELARRDALINSKVSSASETEQSSVDMPMTRLKKYSV